MRQRTERLAQKCSEFGLDIRRNDSLHKPNSWEFLVSKRYHLVWCNVFKAASTSWMYNFNILAGYSPAFLRKSNVVPLELARKRYERVTVDQVNVILISFAYTMLFATQTHGIDIVILLSSNFTFCEQSVYFSNACVL